MKKLSKITPRFQEQGKLKILTECTLVHEYKILKLDAVIESVAGLLNIFTHNKQQHRHKSTMIKTTLNNLADTTALAHYLATFLTQQKNIRTVLLKGKMGSGKTTFTKALVEKLANADKAEVSSPSFTICNYYPTNPAVLHCDLYRVGANLPDELLEEWDNINPNYPIIIIEWAEYIPRQDLPLEYLDITFKSCQNCRKVTIELCSSNANLDTLSCNFMNQSNLDQWIKQ